MNECQDLIDTVVAHTLCSLCGDVTLWMLITIIFQRTIFNGLVTPPIIIKRKKKSSFKSYSFPQKPSILNIKTAKQNV